MRIAIAFAWLAGCGGEPGPPSMPCDVMSRELTVRHDPCLVNIDGALALGEGVCPLTEGVFCGAAASCPSADWTIECDDSGCRYLDDHCTLLDVDDGSYLETETLDGVDGIAVEITPGQCEFRECE